MLAIRDNLEQCVSALYAHKLRASLTMLRHPRQGAERIRGRMDRRRDLHELAALGMSQSDFYKVTEDWSRLLHEAIDAPWPCPDAAWYAKIWDSTISDLTAAGMRVGLASYSGWSDGDQRELRQYSAGCGGVAVAQHQGGVGAWRRGADQGLGPGTRGAAV